MENLTPCTSIANLKESIKKFNELVETKNKSFNEMTKLEKRVEVAKDVLKQIDLGKFKVKSKTYLNFIDETGESCDITCDNLQNDQIKCNVCAIGGMFVSFINKRKEGHLNGNDDHMVSTMSELFSEEELRIIEHFFERWQGDFHYTPYKTFRSNHDTLKFNVDDVLKNAKRFQRIHSRSNERLIAIMNNIIDNNGNFIFNEIKI